MAKKMCDLCQNDYEYDMIFGVRLCKDCLIKYRKAINGDEEAGNYFCDPHNFPQATEQAKAYIIMSAAKKFNKIKEIKETEQKRQDFANSFGEFYEYDVVTIVNEDHGQVDKAKMLKILNERAKLGWKLHTIYSNELGKNALRILGFGVNATACEDVLIFERRLEKF